MTEEYLYQYDESTELTKISTYTLIKICQEKVDKVKAYDPTTALIIFVYDTEYKHNIFQLCVYRDNSDYCLIWRPYINNALGEKIKREEDLESLIGNYLFVEISDMNLDEELRKLVAEQKITEKDLEKIHNCGKEHKVDNKALQEYTKEECSKDKTITGLPSVLDGYGMPGNNPYLNQYNTSVLQGKGKPPILTDEQLAERLATPGNLKQTKSGIYLVQN